RIRKILKFLHEKFDLRFTLDFVEQSSYLMRSFDPQDVSPFTDTQRFEMLLEEANLPGKYDLIFLIHSIFAFEGAMVDKVLSLLNPSGTIVIVSNAEDSFLGGLKKILDSDYEDGRFEITDVLGILGQREITHRKTTIETKWAALNSNLDSHIRIILDWLSLGKSDDLDECRGQQVREYIRGNCIDLGRRTLFSEREVIVVANPRS